MGRLNLLAIVVMLSGCSTLEKLANSGADINDEAIRNSKFMICKGASIGSIMREFNTKEKAEGWVKICLGENDTPPLLLEAIDE